MKNRKAAPSGKKQLALELGDCRGKLAVSRHVPTAKLAEPDSDSAPSNIICIASEIARQEQAERGMYYANIVALAKHLD